MSENNKIPFSPVRGYEENIRRQDVVDGYIYFATDSGNIYVDAEGERHTMGGSGSSGIHYTNASEEDVIKVYDEEEDKTYTIPLNTFENPIVPKPDDLLLNADGRFFRVISYDSETGLVTTSLIAVSGSGGGGDWGPVEQDLFLDYEGIDILGSTYIYGQDNVISFLPRSTADPTVSFKLVVRDLNGVYDDIERQENMYNGEAFEFNTNLLPNSDNLEIKVIVNSLSARYHNTKEDGLVVKFSPIKVLNMYLEKPADITMDIQRVDCALPFIPYFPGLGGENSPIKVHYSIDGAESTNTMSLSSENSAHKQELNIEPQAHGMHTIHLWLATTINGREYQSSSIVYEVPFVELGNETPIIWIKDELGTITNYEPAVVQYMVYSSVAEAQGANVEVSLYHNNDLLNAESVTYQSGAWLSMDLTPYYEFIDEGKKDNKFSLVCGSASKTIEFVVDDTNARDLSLKYPNRLRMNFESIGRSNKEIRVNRPKWVSKVNDYTATLNDFNWYTNGWMNDNNGMGSYLSVANGASVTIPLPITGVEDAMALNTLSNPWTFEIRFRIRNAKKFATLVTEIPLYKYLMPIYNDNEEIIDWVESEDMAEQTLDWIQEHGYVVKLDDDGNPEMNEKNTTKKITETEKYIAMKMLNASGEGFAIGTQEAYFSTAGPTVNVKYKENEVISIAFVVDKAKGLSIYLNGILSGVGDLDKVSGITMGDTVKFEINSEYCDFDLYKFRIYPIALTMPDIIHNYISDIKNISIYDENELTDPNDATALSYSKLLAYNAAHPDDPTMPYAVIDMTSTAQGTGLPYAKGNKRSVRIEFTNPVADYLLTQPSDKGGISPFRYYTHCPSFTADNVEIDVQGTSSQKYPRRNFKTKFKKSKNWVYTKGELAGMPVFGNPVVNEDETTYETYTLSSGDSLTGNWHMDHETIGSKTFTWKIDYMESSGSYNTGFVNLMGSGIYDKHPLEDLGISGINPDDYRVNVYGFPMLVFHKTGENDYTYIGRYNLNLDKSSNERYGFELKKPHPYKINPETNKAFNIKDVAECWELRDNQGTWCSWRFPNAEARYNGFRTLMAGSNASNPKYEVAQHFEARYHANADQFEYAQNIILGKSNDKDYSADIGGNTLTAACNYVYNKLSNLEILFKWLDKTDLSALPIDPANYATLDTPERILVSGQITKRIANPDFNYAEYVQDPDNYPEPEFIYVLDEDAILEQGVTYETETVGGIDFIYGVFTKDSREYRRQKFYSEFEKHLDLDYCCTYFVMTELMLCYDSRGKNMMIASWGPREEGGDYIWYPIFYDIDTQLGLNNVGAKLWDYDENNTENGTFSTKDSVLWTNLYDVFYNKVLEKYIALRKDKITEKTIEDAYLCRGGTTFDSYAMMGKRPIVAIGLDEYYKYVLPVTQEWINQEGKPTTANYLYACQGDRILSRELLIENRLLYMDSKWGGGSFSINTGGMAGANFRSTGNKPSTSSDIYLNGKRWSSQANAYIDDNTVTYPMPYYDAVPEYKVTPYLNFYVTTFVDENTFRCDEAYNEAKYPDGIPTVISPSVAEGYRSGQVDQQLNYFAGSSYISSFGDLSTKYMNEIHFPTTERLLDITLGSDAPDYFNAEVLNPLELYTEVNVDGTVKPGHEKPLLQKINLTHMRGVNNELDVRSPSKLEEFRALDTKLKYALFADGAPLNTVHLPNTITRLIFTQNKELTKVITDTPVVADMITDSLTGKDKLVYRPHEEYEGLFVDGLTNYDPVRDAEVKDYSLKEISFDGDALGYGSYQILKNAVAKKRGTSKDNRLSIRMADVNWTPYVQVEYGETKLSGVQYYYLTDHSTYELYDRADNLWYEDTLNGKVYTYNDNMDESIIQDMELFELFYNDKNAPTSGVNQFTNNVESMINQRTYPTISGEVYISNANGEAIQESDLTDKYGVAFPNLKIRVANINPAYLAKFVHILQNGKEEEIDIIRYPHEDGQVATITSKMPYQQYCDFLGWALVKNPSSDSDWFVKYDYENGEYESILNPQAFSNEKDAVTFYAIFQQHPYIVSFRNPDGTVFATTTATYGQPATGPSQMPWIDDSALPLEETYKFKGYSKEMVPLNATDRVINQSLVKLNTVYVTHDMDLWAVYRKQNVHDEPTDLSCFTIVASTGELSPASGYTGANGLRGKITIPLEKDGVTVTQLTGFANQSNLTHVFMLNAENSSITSINQYAFRECTNLKYFEWPHSLQIINVQAFMGCTWLSSVDFSQTQLQEIKDEAFRVAIGGDDINIYLPGSTLREIDANAFSYMNEAVLGNFTFGSSTDLLDWDHFRYYTPISQQNGGKANGLKYVFYVPANVTTEQIDQFLAGSFNAGNYQILNG